MNIEHNIMNLSPQTKSAQKQNIFMENLVLRQAMKA